MDKHERLKILRILNRYTQEGLAGKVDIKQASIASYERGAYGIPEAATVKLAEHLLVDPAYLSYGYPLLSGRVWEPPKEAKGLLSDLAALLPSLIEENKFTKFVKTTYVDGEIVLMSADDGRKCLLLTSSPATSAAVLAAIVGLKGGVTQEAMEKVRIGDTASKFLCDFDISDFGIEGLRQDYFHWPDGFAAARLAPDTLKALSFVLDEAVPYLLEQALVWSREAQDEELFVEKSVHGIKRAIETAVARLVAQEGQDAVVYLRDEIDKAYAQALGEIDQEFEEKYAAEMMP
ncbi:MAG: helix-turn-helix transcriptional regulator [Betaproteobacteria bacterium]|nr:helix-turn-helix transcriptional regulator [Betaproteobacteria bacterium]